METALQEAIENAKTAKENDKNKDYVTYDEVIEMLTELLPKEREDIQAAYQEGREDEYHKEETKNAQEYYETNFNK